MRLYHFTCDHGARGIAETGLLLPNLHPVLGVSLTWLTPSPKPTARALGLVRRRKGRITLCNRMEYRFVIETDAAVPWTEYRDGAGLLPALVAMLEDAPGVVPDAWWVATKPVAAVAS